ncbi:MAG: bifunctional phosphoglucose/phosphomannose isomerase [Chthonomonas sp.]|nr:bifunctional phosphoglucose/phosphomannose isomerase [Chthonomonas sp.]
MPSSQLDYQDFVLRNDPKGMFALTKAFPSQCADALRIAATVTLPSIEPNLVVLTGLGGSAAGGDFTKALFDEFGKVSFLVNRDYQLPSFVNRETLVFVTSYSGNTEETLSAYADAMRREAMLIAVTSGGTIGKQAAVDGIPIITIPGGQPPRTALGYMLMPVIYACVELGLLPAQDWGRVIEVLEATVDLCCKPFEQNPAKQIAISLHGRLGVLYGLGNWQGIVANRWKGQLNENSKNLALSGVFPELNHNEILGWVKAKEQGVSQFVGVLLNDGHESPKMKKRFEVTANLVKDVCPFTSIQPLGETLLEKMLSLALLGDFVSLYLAALNDVDPENIDSINFLKSELSNVASV